MSDLLLWDKLLTRKLNQAISLTKDLDYEDKCSKKEEPAVDNIIIKFRAY
jgi:hypothetical protein